MASKQDLLSQFQMRKLIIFENSTGFKDWTCRQRGKLQADSRSEMRTMSGSVSWCHGSDSDVVLSEIGCTKFDGYHFGVHLPGILLEVYILHFQRKSCECWVPPTLGLIIPWSKLDELLIFWGRSSIRQEIYTLYPLQEFPNSGTMWDDHKYTMFWPGRSSSMPFTTGSAQEQRGAHSQARAPCVRGGPFTGWLPNLGFVRLAAQKSWCGYGSIPIDTFLVGYSHP